MLGTLKLKNCWHSLTISMLLVLNSFTKKRLIVKSRDDKSDLVRGHASKPYSKTGIHLHLYIVIFILFILSNISRFQFNPGRHSILTYLLTDENKLRRNAITFWAIAAGVSQRTGTGVRWRQWWTNTGTIVYTRIWLTSIHLVLAKLSCTFIMHTRTIRDNTNSRLFKVIRAHCCIYVMQHTLHHPITG